MCTSPPCHFAGPSAATTAPIAPGTSPTALRPAAAAFPSHGRSAESPTQALFLACAPEQHDENWEIIQEILGQGKSVPITALELELAQNKICSGMILGSERPSNRLFSIGNAWTIRRKYETIQEASEHYRNVTLESVQSAFEKLAHRTSVTVSVGPEG